MTYRFGMFEEAGDTSDVATIVLEGEALPPDILVAILDNRLLEMGGVYGDLEVGTQRPCAIPAASSSRLAPTCKCPLHAGRISGYPPPRRTRC
jgi:hypothetical protein